MSHPSKRSVANHPHCRFLPAKLETVVVSLVSAEAPWKRNIARLGGSSSGNVNQENPHREHDDVCALSANSNSFASAWHSLGVNTGVPGLSGKPASGGKSWPILKGLA